MIHTFQDFSFLHKPGAVLLTGFVENMLQRRILFKLYMKMLIRKVFEKRHVKPGSLLS